MLHFFNNWFNPASYPAHQGQSDSSFGGTIIAAALGAIALISANGFDRTNPELATLLRCTAGGIGLFWLFSRCFSNNNGHSPVQHAPGYQPVYVAPMASAPVYFNPVQPPYHAPPKYHANMPPPVAPHIPPFSLPPAANTVYPYAAVHAASHSVGAGSPPTNSFPTVHRAPAQPDSTPMHTAPHHRGPSAGAFSFPSVAPAPHVGGGSGSTGFPNVQRASAGGENSSHAGNQRQLFAAAKTRN